MSGMLEDLLRSRHGEPICEIDDDSGLLVRRFLAEGDPQAAVLYIRPTGGSACPPDLEKIYGDVHAATIAGGSLKVAACGEPEVYGVYLLEEYRELPELEDVVAEHPDIVFFMDAGNVYFYGTRSGALVEFDSETGELTDRNDLRSSLGEVIDEWESAAPTA